MESINEKKFKTTNGFICRWESLDEKEKITLIKHQAQKVFKSFNKKTLSNKKFVEAGILSRKGLRGGLATSLFSKNELANDWYIKDLEDLKKMVKSL